MSSITLNQMEIKKRRKRKEKIEDSLFQNHQKHLTKKKKSTRSEKLPNYHMIS